MIYKLWISILVLLLKIDTGVEPGGTTFSQELIMLGVILQRTETGQKPCSIHVVHLNDTAVPK